MLGLKEIRCSKCNKIFYRFKNNWNMPNPVCFECKREKMIEYNKQYRLKKKNKKL